MKNIKGSRFGSGGLPPMQGVIPASATLHGDLEFSGGLWIDGHVRGDLRGREGQDPVLVINHDASIKGHLIADHIIVHGTVSGGIEARASLTLGPSARVRGGHIRYGEVSIAEGATVSGQMHCTTLPGEAPAVSEAPRRITKVRSAG